MPEQLRSKKARRLFRPWEADEVAKNKTTLRRALESPHIEDKSAVRDAIKRLDNMEREHGVPDLGPVDRDKAAKRVKELEGQIREGMLSHEEMRRNPPGAVDRNVWWERRNKQRIKQWRDLNAALHKGIPADQAQTLFSPERLRPVTSTMNMHNAQIPEARSFSFPSAQYQENWEAIFKPKPPEEPSVLDEPPEQTTEESLLEELEESTQDAERRVRDHEMTQRALGQLAKGRKAS